MVDLKKGVFGNIIIVGPLREGRGAGGVHRGRVVNLWYCQGPARTIFNSKFPKKIHIE